MSSSESHFSAVPQINIPRSRFKRDYTHKTTFQAGKLIPFCVQEVLPGDTVSLTQKTLVRLTPSVHPTMDNCYLDIYWFFVPRRLTWSHWQQFWGESDDPFLQPIEYEIPQITAPSGGWTQGTLADYMGIPTKVENISIDACYARGYCKIWNDWFRDVNLQYAAAINLGDNTQAGSNGSDIVTDAQLYGKPLPCAKFHDYFTSCLPQALRGESPSVGLSGYAPVLALDDADNGSNTPVKYRTQQVSTAYITIDQNYTNVDNSKTPTSNSSTPYNLVASLSAAASITITQLRQAIAIQHFMERSARAGNRYTEYVRSAFGVISPDARLQRAEYLGGKRVPINMSQVIQTSSTDSTSPQGNVVGLSLTHDIMNGGTHSFTEHGILYGLMTARLDNTYQQGINRQFSRRSKFDFYDPCFAAISEMAVLNKEIYATGTDSDNMAFGYQEPWADYRYIPNQVSGLFRSNATGTLDSWTYAQKYSALPILGSTWIQQDTQSLDRTLAVSSAVSDPFIADIYIDMMWTRPMPLYGIPGIHRI